MEKEFYFKGQKICYSEKGKGFPIVIVHGWTSQNFNSELENLLIGQGFHVVSPLFSSEGIWSRDDYIKCILKLTASLGLKRFSLLGHSWGGTIAIKMACKFPKRIQALFLCAPEVLGVGIVSKIKWMARFKKLFQPVFFLYTISRYLSGSKGMYDIYKKTKGAALEVLRLQVLDDVVPCLKRINVPTLVITGDEDEMVPVKNVEFAANHILSATFKVIPGGKHAIEGELAKEVVGSIVDFLTKKVIHRDDFFVFDVIGII